LQEILELVQLRVPGQMALDIPQGDGDGGGIPRVAFDPCLKTKGSQSFQMALQAHVVEDVKEGFTVERISLSPLFAVEVVGEELGTKLGR
jgi:hypothetical protein